MEKRVIALGFFDGVHKGHGELLRRTKARAAELSAKSSVLTYSQHPSEALGKMPVKLINTTDERVALISELFGIDDIVIKDFTKEYASLPCREFVSEVLVRELSCVHVVAGYDFRFGRGAQGDAEMLSSLCREHGLDCDIEAPVCVDGRAVSSTEIRALIADGRIKEATRLLGHRPCMISEIQHGAKLGGKMDFPTINQSFSQSVQVPKYGVYSSRTVIDGKEYMSVTDIGVRPTVTDAGEVRAETNILDFSGTLYGKKIRVELCDYLREEKKFPTVALLREQIARDVCRVRSESGKWE